MLTRFVRDDSGATAIEYGLISALIAVVVIAALSVLGTQISGKFSRISTSISSAGS